MKPRPFFIVFSIVILLVIFTIYPFTLSMQKEALKIKERFGFQYYDSLILATALAYECSILYSEDMQNGQKIKTLQIINPFS